MPILSTCTHVEIHRAAGAEDYIRHPRGEYCPVCGPPRGKNPTSQQRFRREVLQRDGYQCVWLEDDVRCPMTVQLEAAHVVPYAKGGSDDPSNGYTLCHRHHVAFEKAQRTGLTMATDQSDADDEDIDLGQYAGLS